MNKTFFEEATKIGKSCYPLKFTTYLHGEGKENENRQKLIEALGLDTSHSIADEIRGCDYEIGLVWEKLDKNSPIIPIGLLKGNTQYRLVKHEGLGLTTGEFNYD
jgi:hypothetical protein